MKHIALLDHPEAAVIGAWALLDVPALGIGDGWLELASRLTVSAILLIGLYFLNKMKEASEAKREQAIKALVSNTEKAHQQVREVYDARIADLTESNNKKEAQIKELQSKLFEK